MGCWYRDVVTRIEFNQCNDVHYGLYGLDVTLMWNAWLNDCMKLDYFGETYVSLSPPAGVDEGLFLNIYTYI